MKIQTKFDIGEIVTVDLPVLDENFTLVKREYQAKVSEITIISRTYFTYTVSYQRGNKVCRSYVKEDSLSKFNPKDS